MKTAPIKSDLARHSRDTGIPVPELRRMCLAAGLDLLERGELEARKPAEKLPIYLPADDVRFLREMRDAADIGGGADAFVDAIIGDALRDTERGCGGVPELIFDGWDFETEKEKKRAEAAVQAVVNKWRARGSSRETTGMKGGAS